MKIINTIQEWKKELNTFELATTIGFVPTLGGLHAGHISLFNQCRKQNTTAVASIFLNPTQFNNQNDLITYPSNLEDDIKQAQQAGIDYLFLPTKDLIYPDNYTFQVVENDLSMTMEGEHRPGHFTGVLTVVMKLLNIIKPNTLYLGEKDYQQAMLIKNMIDAFFMDVSVNICPTIRDNNGLALSSRNQKLNTQQQKIASMLSKVLTKNCSDNEAINELNNKGFNVEYIKTYNNRRYGAINFENVRLIDNVSLNSI